VPITTEELLRLLEERLAAIRPPPPPELALGAGSAQRLYREGWGDKEQLRERLARQGYSGTRLELLVTQAELDELADKLADTVRLLRESVEKGVIAPEEMFQELKRAGMREDRAQLLTRLRQLELMPRPG